ncbi:MAG TPA: hypothetical protein DD670_08225 [Planctomycetaceae bacterium]|nr:hypothetical protein [Planctomycetaceae bacterium]
MRGSRVGPLVVIGLIAFSLVGVFSNRPTAAQAILDLATARPQIYTALENLRVSGAGYGQYAMSVGGTTPGYYGSLDAALMRTIMGEDLMTSITEQQRTEWIDHLHTFALPDGGYTDTNGHHVLHANGMTVGGLGVLGGRQKYPASPLYRPFDEPNEVADYLVSQINWTNSWGESHKFWGGFHIFSQSSVATSEWKAAVFDWLDANVDPTTGWWRVGQQPSSSAQGLGGGAHIWPMYEHEGHEFPYPERVIDRILSMQAVDGSYAAMGNYLNLDALYGLKYMRSLTPAYRAADIDLAVQKHGAWLAGQLNGYLAANPGAHALLAVVGDLGLMNQLAPALYPDSTGATWSDIFTDPKFYQTAAVEVFAQEPGPPIGADRPSPYAYTVLADSPVGYWRLGETEPGSVGEARGILPLRGLHIGLGDASGPGNVAQPGPRPADGFPGMSADNRAVHLSGQYDHVSVYDAPELDITGELTLEAWIRLDQIPAGNVGIVAKYNGSGNQRSFDLYVDGQTDDGTLGLIISPDGTFTNAATLRNAMALPLDTWLHVAGTYSPGESMRLFINGQQVAQRVAGVPEAIYSSSADLWIGCNYALTPSSHFAGLIDEVAVYDRVLSHDEIWTHYLAAFALPGDADLNGRVDHEDAAILADHWGSSGADWSRGDFNGDEMVNALDASILAAHWSPNASSESYPVPEPGVLALLLAGLLGLLGKTRLRRA